MMWRASSKAGLETVIGDHLDQFVPQRVASVALRVPHVKRCADFLAGKLPISPDLEFEIYASVYHDSGKDPFSCGGRRRAHGENYFFTPSSVFFASTISARKDASFSSEMKAVAPLNRPDVTAAWIFSSEPLNTVTVRSSRVR